MLHKIPYASLEKYVFLRIDKTLQDDHTEAGVWRDLCGKVSSARLEFFLVRERQFCLGSVPMTEARGPVVDAGPRANK